jgi:hypothetical protein
VFEEALATKSESQPNKYNQNVFAGKGKKTGWKNQSGNCWKMGYQVKHQG